MEYIVATLSANPKLVNEFLGLLKHASTKEQDANNFTAPNAKTNDYYVIAVDKEKVVGGIKLETNTPDAPHVLAFQRKEVFNTLKKELPFLDIDNLKLADLSHLTVAPEYRRSGAGLQLFQEAFKLSASLGSDITFIWPNANASKSSGDFFSRVRNETPYKMFDVATVDLITDNFDRIRNTKNIIAVTHNDAVAEKLQQYSKGKIPWLPTSAGTAVYASPYGPAADTQAVLLDWDNVMVDDVTPWVSAISHTLRDLKRQGYKIPSNVRSTHSQAPLDYLKTILGDDVAAVAHPILMKHYEELMPKTLHFKPGAQDTLRLLRRHKIPFAIVSNHRDPYLTQQVHHLLEPEFKDTPIFADAQKPLPDALFAAMKTLNVQNPSKVLFVGDSGENDVKAAIAAGVTPVLFSIADMDIVSDLNKTKTKAEIGFVRDHAELQKFLKAQIKPRQSGIAQGM